MNTTRRTFLKAIGGAMGSAALTAKSSGESAAFGAVPGLAKAVSKRPNILYIHSHDTGRFTSPYGFRVPTPNLQQLAQDGVCFTQAHCAAPTCSPSRASLLTGQCPHTNGMLGLAFKGKVPGFSMDDYSHHILHTLRREAGYYSALIGLQHIAENPAVIGFDHLEPISRFPHVEQVVPAAVRFLRNRPSQPFWLEVGTLETHRDYRKPGPEDDPRYILPPSPVPDVEATRQDMAGFHATVRKFDWGVGEVLAALESEGLAENTIVLSTTDHGIAFPEMKCNLYDGGTEVHLVMRGPGGFSGGRTCDALISQLDVFPTICELLEIAPPVWLEGKSFLPVLRGERQEVNDEVHAEVNYHCSYEPMRAVRTKRWKYIRRFGNNRHPVLPNCDDGLSKTYWLENGWANQVVAPEELYDLTFDPNERDNLAADPARKALLEEMRGRLLAWMRKTADPLLKGLVKAPPGLQFNPPGEISPGEPTVPWEALE